MFDKILVANRGEIACRILATANRLGINTVAVYSSIDAKCKHVALADESYLIGPAPSQQSYLCVDKIIDAAKQSGANAIHPGYGFLAENSAFAKACHDNDIVFIGPSSEAIESMGSKTAAKILMKQHKVPTTPGYEGDNQNPDFLAQRALEIGLPVLVKASAGGGGKGMRLVTNENEIYDAIASAKREAQSSFGDDHLLIERYLDSARHVEVQIFCDQHGNGVYLFDRDCSVQRRHQKIIEEAPAPNIDDAIRQQMGETALQAAKAINYCGAGTVEFLFNAPDQFYFMEMNTRLQVEHPVTEKITGIDLVEWQLKVASGQTLPKSQNELTINGHSFEARLCAEDPYQDFKPCCGQVDALSLPVENDHIRIDSGIRAGDTISPYYDPMIAKLITWDRSRDAALQQMQQALDHSVILGIENNIDYINSIIQQDDFKAAKLTTRFIDNHPKLSKQIDSLDDTQLALTCIGTQYLSQQQQHGTLVDNHSPWQQHDHWRPYPQTRHAFFWFNEQCYTVKITNSKSPHHYCLHLDNGAELDCELIWHQQGWFDIAINGNSHRCRAIVYNKQCLLLHQQLSLVIGLQPPLCGEFNRSGNSKLDAPMPGTIVDALVNEGDTVSIGDKLLVMEAMKMESTMIAPFAGTVSALHFKKGDTFAEGQRLIDISSD